ncbi:hypothetical protein ABID13_002332 [Enterocloster citroniae]|uniref:PylC N-terminal domain-containing protein n=2 Tax=Enterocloster citroniae TaxID=358743 RepID=A0ABV2FXE2_9FIRM
MGRKMIRIMILGGGTAAAWAISKAVKDIGKNRVLLYVCDINPPHLVHTSTLADRYFVIPSIKSVGYYEYMMALFEKEKIDILVPLIDWDLSLFAYDNADLLRLGIYAASPYKQTFNMLSNKRNMTQTLEGMEIEVPHIISSEFLKPECTYYVKPEIGFGSRNSRAVLGRDLLEMNLNGMIVQELCLPEEITVDVFCDGKVVKSICRERIEVKAGVCTKARIFEDQDLSKVISKLASKFSLPHMNCVQFMRSQQGKWLLTDFNLRLGGGSALSAAVGFKMAESAVALWLEMPELVSIDIPAQERFVVRCFEEIVTK